MIDSGQTYNSMINEARLREIGRQLCIKNSESETKDQLLKRIENIQKDQELLCFAIFNLSDEKQ